MKQLNFGSGFDIKEGFENVDKEDFDFNSYNYPIKNNTYDYIYSKNVFEHVHDAMKTLKELIRIAKNGATIEIIVPHYTNKCAYSSLDHNHYFNEIAFEEFIRYNPNLVEIIELTIVPTWFGKLLIFEWLRKTLTVFNMGGIYGEINCKYKVIK